MERSISDKFRWFSSVMTVMIVCYHAAPHILSTFISDQDCSGKYISNFYNTFGQYALSYFFATSGFFFVIGKESYLNKIKKRIITLLVPYAVWNCLYLLYFILTDLESIYNNGLKGILIGFTLTPFDGPLWYIPVLFLYFVFSIPLIDFIRKLFIKKYSGVLIILGIVIVSIIHGLFSNKIFSFEFDFYVERFVRFIPAYIFGIAYSKSNLVFNFNKTLCILLFLITLIISVLLGDTEYSVFLLYISMFSLWNSISHEDIVSYKKPKYMNLFVVYALHDVLIRVLLSIGSRLPFGFCNMNVVFAAIIPVLVTALILVISIVVSVIIQKNKILFNIMTGGR